jgi:hypothetical protein
MLYEIGYIQNGEIVRGGVKAPLLTVGKWIREQLELCPDAELFAIPANGEAMTEQELHASLDAYFEERGLS